MAGTVPVVPAGAAVGRRGARHRGDSGIPALVEGRGAGDLLRGMPGAVGLAGDERLVMTGRKSVVYGNAVDAGGGRLHRKEHGAPALVEGLGAGDLLRGMLGADGEAGVERLSVAGVETGAPAGAAVARRGARHRGDRGVPALVEGRGAGDLLRGMPGAVGLADDERLVKPGAVLVVPAGAAVARRGARHRTHLSSPPPFTSPAAR